MSEPTRPEQSHSIMGDTGSRTRVNNRQPMAFQVVPLDTDPGLNFYDPQGYYVNMSLNSARSLVSWLTEWCAYQQFRFKPLGFMLHNVTTNQRIELKDGARATLVGDSFVITDTAGAQIGDVLSALEWAITPIIAPAPATTT